MFAGYLRQGTAADIEIGPVWHTTTGALKDDLAYNATGINCDLHKNGVKSDLALANSAGAGYWRASTSHKYLLTLATGNVDTLGRLKVSLDATDYVTTDQVFTVLSAAMYDVLFGAVALSTLAAGAAMTLTGAYDAALAQIALIKATTDTLTAPGVTVVSPVTADGDIEIVQADDYYAADGRSIPFLIADPTHVLGLEHATVKLHLEQATWTATSVVSTTAGYTVHFEPTTAQTAVMTAVQNYHLKATLANGHVVTLAYAVATPTKTIPEV